MPRPPAYFDTSVVVKRYIREPGATRARTLLRRHRVVSSALTAVEAVAAMCRRRRSGELTATDFTAVVSRLQKDRAAWEVMSVSPPVLDDAEEPVGESRGRPSTSSGRAEKINEIGEGFRSC